MAIAANLGYPRLVHRRELKSGLEAYWSARIDAQALHAVAQEVRREAWLTQRDAGMDRVPSNDFSFYDHGRFQPEPMRVNRSRNSRKLRRSGSQRFPFLWVR